MLYGASMPKNTSASSFYPTLTFYFLCFTFNLYAMSIPHKFNPAARPFVPGSIFPLFFALLRKITEKGQISR